MELGRKNVSTISSFAYQNAITNKNLCKIPKILNPVQAFAYLHYSQQEHSRITLKLGLYIYKAA